MGCPHPVKLPMPLLIEGPIWPPNIPVEPSAGLKNALAMLPDPKPVLKAANLSPNPRAPKLPLPTTLPPTVPKLPMPPISLPAPNPDKPPVIAPLRPLPAAKLAPAPITPASTGPTPGIKLASGPITGATFLITFLMPLASFLKKPCCSMPVNVFKEAKPVP